MSTTTKNQVLNTWLYTKPKDSYKYYCSKCDKLVYSGNKATPAHIKECIKRGRATFFNRWIEHSDVPKELYYAFIKKAHNGGWDDIHGFGICYGHAAYATEQRNRAAKEKREQKEQEKREKQADAPRHAQLRQLWAEGYTKSYATNSGGSWRIVKVLTKTEPIFSPEIVGERRLDIDL